MSSLRTSSHLGVSHAWFIHGAPELLSEEGNERWREGERTGIHILKRKQAESAHLEEIPRRREDRVRIFKREKKILLRT